jgi:hypothetical protein
MLQALTWQDVREEVKAVNLELFNSIEAISPDDSFVLYKVKYRFGDLIINRGVMQIPSDTSEHLIPFHEAKLSTKDRENLSYSPIPAHLILKNSCEIFVTNNERIIPMHFAKAGSVVGLFETLDYITNTQSAPLWDVAAGARSIFMLPHITEKQGISRLMKTYRLPHNIQLKNLSDQWGMFKRILEKENTSDPWSCEILFFSKKWFELEDDLGWSAFYRYIFKQGWQRIQYTFNQIERAFVWQAIIEVVEKRNLKPRHYIADTVKHLFAIATNRYPGFIPIDFEHDAAPIKLLQDIFIDVYGLKNYYPTFMGVRTLDQMDKQPVYYSLNLPTLVEGIPPLEKKANRIMVDLREIKLLIDTFKERSSYLEQHHKFKNINFNYYHTEKDMYGEIQASQDIATEDSRFLYKGLPFCLHSHFWRGCIKISDY